MPKLLYLKICNKFKADLKRICQEHFAVCPECKSNIPKLINSVLELPFLSMLIDSKTKKQLTDIFNDLFKE